MHHSLCRSDKANHIQFSSLISLGHFSSLNRKTNSQMAVLSCVDSKTVMFLETVPDMLIHTETKPSASLAMKGGTNSTRGAPATKGS